ncbi:MAG: 30S ribosomal protein S17e [Nanoarchaeota archaeon]|nr:30S ribosomal protein S17e [Nanoarchaeota archaeon]
MGKIKSKLIKRTAKSLLKKEIGFSEDFEINKKILGSEMPSKKLRNQLAGFLARVKKQERISKPKILKAEK